MSEETKERCLEPFRVTKKEKGTGMGLAMVHGIVSRHGGSIEIKSLTGYGTTVSLRFPVNPGEENRTESAAEGETVSPLWVLVAEDEPAIRELLVQFLSEEGYRVVVAKDGAEGWERFQDARFDLVITDFSMPRLSGEDLAKRIKAIDPETPVLMLTGYGAFLDFMDDAPSVVDKILSKPLRLESLKSEIERFAAKRGEPETSD